MSDSFPLRLGRYRHYKGKEYTVLGTARHSETLEDFVVYRQEYGDHRLWIRPRQMFLEMVKVNGQDTPRFRFLGSSEDTAPQPNLLRDLPPRAAEEFFQSIAAGKTFRLERIVSHGQASPEGVWYDQEQQEWVVVLQGSARLRFENDEVLDLKPGDHVMIAAHRKHRVDSTSPDEPTVWLAVHYNVS